MSITQKTAPQYFVFPVRQAGLLIASQILPFFLVNYPVLQNISVFILIAGFLYNIARDGHGILSMRGLVNTSNMGKNMKWYVFAYFMLFPFFIIIYDIRMVIDSFQAERIQEKETAIALKENILRLERELGIGQNINTEEDKHN